MILPLVKEPHPILRQRAQRVLKVSPEIRRLIGDMVEAMHSAHGVGLAANQVGSPWHILVADPEATPGDELILLNARILRRRGSISSSEGCLSLPGISADVTRAAEVTVEGLDAEGRPRSIVARGLLARILQHEVDHLEGRLYVDRVSYWQRRRLIRRYRELAQTLTQIDLKTGERRRQPER